MTLHQPPWSETRPIASPMPPERGRWSRQRVAQGAWIVLVLLLLVIFVANLPAFFQYARRLCCKNAGGMVNSAVFKNSRGVPIMNQQHPFKWRHFEAEIILLRVRWYLRYSLSYRDLEELMRERGLSVDHTTISRWVQRYAP